MGFMSHDEIYIDDFDHAHYAEHWKKHEDQDQNIDKVSTKITEWIWNKACLEKDESWHDLMFDEVNEKIWELINVS